MSHRGRGLNEVPPHKQHLLGASHVVGSATSYVLPLDLSMFLPKEVLDQFNTNSCPGGGTACLLYVALACAGTPLPWIPSPKGIYGDVRCIEQTGTGPLLDTGADPADLISSLASEGIRAMNPPVMPDGRVYDLSVENVGERPTLAEDEDSQRDIVLGTSLLDSSADDFIDQICGALAEKAPVGVGIHATPAFEAYGDNVVTDSTPAFDDVTGVKKGDGHWVGVYAARQGVIGTELLLRNSWGPRWGLNGNVWVTANWLKTMCFVALKFKCTLKAS
jgi:hypothetical protein